MWTYSGDQCNHRTIEMRMHIYMLESVGSNYILIFSYVTYSWERKLLLLSCVNPTPMINTYFVFYQGSTS